MHCQAVDKTSILSPPFRPAAMAAPKAKDPSLDFFSDEFDAAKALHTPGLLPPIPKTKPRNSVHACSSLLQPNDPNYRPERDKAPQIKTEAAAKLAVDTPVALAKYNTAFEAPPQLRQHHSRQGRVTRPLRRSSLDSGAEKPRRQLEIVPEHLRRGPLDLLRQLFERKCRVTVWIRRWKGMRGTCSGYSMH
jgi:hypothetical protein